MKFFSDRTYRFLRNLLAGVFRIAHPVVKVKGRENIPEGPVIFTCNHSAFSDPIWLIGYSKLPVIPRTMAKRELIHTPVIGWLLTKLAVIPVDRDGNDLTAMKTALKALKEGRKLLIFPEGTRIRRGKISQPHSGAALLSVRTGTPILPCYITAKKRFWGRLDIVYGKPYLPTVAGPKPTGEELDRITEDMMKTIYAMGEKL